jgi:hypothetical protein
MTKPTEFLAGFSLLFIAIIWGSTFIIVRQSAESTLIFSFLFMRFALAGVLLSLISTPKLKAIDKRVLADGLMLGIALFLAFCISNLRANGYPRLGFGLYYGPLRDIRTYPLKFFLEETVAPRSGGRGSACRHRACPHHVARYIYRSGGELLSSKQYVGTFLILLAMVFTEPVTYLKMKRETTFG